MADITTIATQGRFGTVTDRIVSIATWGRFDELGEIVGAPRIVNGYIEPAANIVFVSLSSVCRIISDGIEKAVKVVGRIE